MLKSNLTSILVVHDVGNDDASPLDS